MDLVSRQQKRRYWLVAIAVLLFTGVVAAGLVYRYVVTGGLVARQSPSSFEVYVARHLVDLSIPDDARQQANPLSTQADGPEVAAGRHVYQQHCEACHGYDGAGRTASGSGLYPRPPDLRTTRYSDGALFYLIRNGIRNTGMPGWQLPDRQTWQLVAFLRHLPQVAQVDSTQPTGPSSGASYVGSAACSECHRDLYDRWKNTLMANVVRDPREHPDAIIPDMSKPDPVVHFTRSDIDFVYGSKWKQRYFKKIGDDYYPLPAQWDVTHKQWKPYQAKDDWWVPYYPADNMKRPTSATCDGCHSVNYNITTHTVSEWNVGCEKCHGPGSEHVQDPTHHKIINPSRLNFVQANDACIQCHSQGRPVTNPIGGKYYDWPVGFTMGDSLAHFWKLENPALGQTTFTHYSDGTAHKNRMQGNDYVQSVMYTHGVACSTCHDSHGSNNPSLLRKPPSTLCLDCHGPGSPNGPHAATLEQHTHHKPGSAGSDCIACHMPKIAQTLGDVNVRSHTFRFITPVRADALKIPNACTLCHADKSTAWANQALNDWGTVSPWR